MKIVIAFGGNALGNTPDEQQTLIKGAVNNLIPLIKAGHQLVIGHGNGPQVGTIYLAFAKNEEVPNMPFAECTAMSQGYIGFHIQKAMNEALRENNLDVKVASIITEVAVDENDPSFKNPTKPVGPFYTKEEADTLASQSGETYIEDAGRGYRKVVASPKPIEIKQIDTVKDLLNSGHIVIAGGGGGIPVFMQDLNKSASAVIDKDSVSALMAENLNADALIILTNVKQAMINYGKENSEALGVISIDEAKKYIAEEHFAKGSMLPKVEAALRFAENSKQKAIITSLDNLENALNEIEATIIKY